VCGDPLAPAERGMASSSLSIWNKNDAPEGEGEKRVK
jgi:hypothetical protein